MLLLALRGVLATFHFCEFTDEADAFMEAAADQWRIIIGPEGWLLCSALEEMTKVFEVRTVDPLTVSLCQSQGALPRQPPVGGRF